MASDEPLATPFRGADSAATVLRGDAGRVRPTNRGDPALRALEVSTQAGLRRIAVATGDGVDRAVVVAHDAAPFADRRQVQRTQTIDMAETDRVWNAIIGNGGRERACGWCKDRWGLSSQITRRALTAVITDPDALAAHRAFEAMMQMTKIDIAAIKAVRGS